MTRLLTADDLAERWSCTRKHVYNMADGGQLPVVLLGRWKRFREEDIAEFEANGGTAVTGKADRPRSDRDGRNDDARTRERGQRPKKPLRSAAESRKAAAGREVGHR